MSDSEDLLGEDFEWKDELDQRTGTAWREPVPSRPPWSLKADLDRCKQVTTSPGRLALLTLAVAVSVAIVVAVVINAGGNKQASSPAQTRSPGTTPPQTQPQPARPAITISSATVLRAGDHGPAVRTLQRALRRLGFAVGSLDGSFGPKTAAAVIAFQRAHRLSADGLVGATTARALNRALARAG